MQSTSRASYKGHEYRETVLSEVRKGSTSCPSREEILDAAIAANENPRVGNQNKYLDRGEIESGLKSLIGARRRREPEWYGSTVKAGKELDPTLADAMLYGRIIQILQNEVLPTTCAPADRLRTQLLDARDDYRGLFNAIIPLQERGDPNQAKTYFIERKLPGEKSYLYGPFPMPEAGVPAGVNPVSDLDVYRTSPNRASFTFDASSIGGGWKHEVEKIRVDEETRTVTIPWRVYRPDYPSLNGSLSYHGREFRLPPGEWKVQMTDAITGKALKRTTVSD